MFVAAKVLKISANTKYFMISKVKCLIVNWHSLLIHYLCSKNK